MRRVVDYCLRFKENAKGNKRTDALSVEELEQAEIAIARMTQEESFIQECLALERGRQMLKGSKLTSLSPFLDERGLIRVGGRLSQANLPETLKHPVVLPDRHHVTKIIMTAEHQRLHHCGPEQLLHSIRQRYWILSGRREARKVSRACIDCYRRNPKPLDVQMGRLPPDRVRGSLKPFTNTGIAYVGPISKIQWKFIPPRAPHFGGLWEAAVKATKRHFNTVTKGFVWTFEEYYILSTEIESILNSRPLTPLSSSSDDILAFTPAHFLVGDSLLLPADHDYLEVPDNCLSRWQHVQKVCQHYWKRWSKEYLQKRQKWNTQGSNLKISTLVLIDEDNVPPLHWVHGRVVEVHPEADGLVRVATVRTSGGLYKRPVKKPCPLPDRDD
ncbi:uncharacterized protein [Venturia canescens]|uniref:uncharacterized protein n=1 Tax=Venturia canescens TaxID=32260 RepID=UPI001C9BE8F1|nr:uncharacterized protein LOC122412394 [Venturia canescens]